jgi:hypothetical protein
MTGLKSRADYPGTYVLREVFGRGEPVDIRGSAIAISAADRITPYQE